MSSWWDRHLSAPQTPQTPERRDSYPPTAPRPPAAPQRPQKPHQRNPYLNLDEQEDAMWEEEGEEGEGDMGIQQAVAMGGDYRPKAGKVQSLKDADPQGNTNCPSCGSNLYFSRAQGIRRGPPPAPQCGECGYNGLFEQTGSLLNAMKGANTGPVRKARQDQASINGSLDFSHPIHQR